jgi:hypothetical protein
VIAFGQGGALESVIPDETGLFFREPTVESLSGAIQTFIAREWSPAACRRNAARFGRSQFFAAIDEEITKALAIRRPISRVQSNGRSVAAKP